MWHQNNLNKELLIGKFDVTAPSTTLKVKKKVKFVIIYTHNKQFLVVVGSHSNLNARGHWTSQKNNIPTQEMGPLV